MQIIYPCYNATKLWKTHMTQRTDQQNKALHLYFRLVADALNGAGLTVQETLKHQMDIEWNPHRVKELIWRQAQKKILNKESTKDLSKQMEIDEVYETINRWLASMGVESIPFPHHEGDIDNYVV